MTEFRSANYSETKVLLILVFRSYRFLLDAGPGEIYDIKIKAIERVF